MDVKSRLISFILASLVPGVILHTSLEGNKLLVIVLGGVRADSVHTPGFSHMALTGVKAEYLEPVFPATTMPNLYTIMTGLYPASHGQTGDYMYDVEKNLSFTKMHNLHIDSDPLWWENGDPFWVNVMRQKKRAYMYRWPGCDIFIHSIKPTFCKPVDDWQMSVSELRSQLNESLRLFANDSADFVGIYYNGLEETVRDWGQNAYTREAMNAVDDAMGNLQHQMETLTLPGNPSRHLSDIVNLIVVSDHGVTNIFPTRVINMTSILMTSSIRHVINDGSTLQIWPYPEAIERVYTLLNTSHPHYDLYQIGHMPPEWHYMRGPFVAPILLLAHPGYTFLTAAMRRFPVVSRDGETRPRASGWGYSNAEPDMRGVFFARGPHFKRNLRAPGFSGVHLYQVMCAVLGVDMSSNDGSWAVVADMLVATHVPHRYTYPSPRNNLVKALIVLTLLFCLISAGCALWCRRESIRKWYQHRSIRWQPLLDGVV